MQVIPLSPVPSQTFQIVLGGQNCAMAVYQKGQFVYLDLIVNGVPVLNTKMCPVSSRLLLGRQYLGFVGDLAFMDTQGKDDPQYLGLGTRWVLVYAEAGELP